MTSALDWTTRAERLADKLTADGDLHDPAWRSALCTVPRHALVPRYYTHDTSTRPARWLPIQPHDADSTTAWLDLVYSDTTLVTAVADYVDRGVQIPVSSSTKPDLMIRMLEALQIRDGDRVLEIGTGTGYNAALLAARLGDQHVFSVDVDAELVDTARDRLARIGYRPQLAALDGSQGWPEHAPFDRIIATCSVSTIPATWITQTTPGGMVLVDWEGTLGAGNLVALRRTGDRLEGRFLPWWGRFMRLRHEAGASTGTPRPSPAEGRHADSTTSIDPVDLDNEFRFVAQLYLPAGTVQSVVPEPDTLRLRSTRLVTPDGAWCEVDRDPDRSGRYTVRSGGPVALWERIEHAAEYWQRLGRPAWSRFGLTVTSGHREIVWVDEATNPITTDHSGHQVTSR